MIARFSADVEKLLPLYNKPVHDFVGGWQLGVFVRQCVAEGGTGQVGTAEVGTAQVGTGQVGIAQVGFGQVGKAQVGTGQVGSGQVGNGQVSTGQVGTTQVGTGQVGVGGNGDVFAVDGVDARGDTCSRTILVLIAVEGVTGYITLGDWVK